MSKKRYNKQGKLFEERQLSILFDDDTEAVDESPFAEPKREENSSAPVSAEIDAPASEKREYVNFVSFGSGSSGNCAYLGTEHSGILIDAGVDMDKVFSQAKEKKGIDAIESVSVCMACRQLKEKNLPDEIVLRRDMFGENEVKAFERVLNRTIMLTQITRDDDHEE